MFLRVILEYACFYYLSKFHPRVCVTKRSKIQPHSFYVSVNMYCFGFYFLLELNLMQFAINECGCDLAVHDCVLLVYLAMASLQL